MKLFEFHAHYLNAFGCRSIDLYLHFIVFVHPQFGCRYLFPCTVAIVSYIFLIFDGISKNVIISVDIYGYSNERYFIISLRRRFEIPSHIHCVRALLSFWQTPTECRQQMTHIMRSHTKTIYAINEKKNVARWFTCRWQHARLYVIKIDSRS